MTDHHGNDLPTDLDLDLDGLPADRWLAYGIARGWCSPTFCGTHDFGPLTADEEAALDDGDDPCMFVVRLPDRCRRPCSDRTQNSAESECGTGLSPPDPSPSTMAAV